MTMKYEKLFNFPKLQRVAYKLYREVKSDV